MNKVEAKKIIASMMVFYPNYNPGDIDITADAWADVMSEYEYALISSALKSYIRSNSSGFAPAPGQLMDIIHSITVPEELNEMEAWALVSKALRNGCYGAEQEFEQLPPLVQKAVGAPSQLHNWSQTDIESVENVIQSNFMRTYRAVLAREKEISKMPRDIKKIIFDTSQRVALKG